MLLVIDKLDLLELFENEPKIIDEEAGLYKYSRKDEHGFTLTMSLFLYDEYCSLTLEYKDFKMPLYEMGFNKIEKIECSENRLIIKQEDKPESVIVYFKPNYSLTFSERLK